MHPDQIHPLSASFLRLYLLTFLFFSANAILTVMLPLQSDAEGIGKTGIGVMMGAYMLSCMLLRPIAGQAVAKYGARQMLRLLLAVNAAVLILYSLSIVELYIPLRLVQGLVTAFFSMTMQIGIVNALPEKDRAQGVSMYTLSTMMPQLFGPMLALSIWESAHAELYTIGIIALGVLTWLCGTGTGISAERSADVTFSYAETVKPTAQLWKNRTLFICSVVMMLGSAIFTAVFTFLPLYMAAAGEGDAGVYFMIQAGVVVLTRFILRKRIPSDGRFSGGLLAGLLILASAGAQLLALMSLVGAGVYAAAVCIGLAMALLYPTLVTYLTFVLPVQSRHVLIGLFISVYDLGGTLGGLMTGLLADFFSYAAVYACSAVLGLLALAIVIWNRHRMPERTAEG